MEPHPVVEWSYVNNHSYYGEYLSLKGWIKKSPLKNGRRKYKVKL